MAARMLVVHLIGNLGADPETRFTPKGSEITKFNVAATKRIPDPKNEGEWKDDTHWFGISLSGRLATFAKEKLAKGSHVLVVGDLSITEKLDHEGEKHTYYNVWASELYDLTPKERSNGVPLGGGRADTGDLPDPLSGVVAAQPRAAAPVKATRRPLDDDLDAPF